MLLIRANYPHYVSIERLILNSSFPFFFGGGSYLQSMHFNVLSLMTGEKLSKWSFIFLCSAAAAAKSLQSCPTLCDLIDGSPPGSPVPGVLQARTLEWVAISLSSAWKWKVKVKLLSCVRPSATPWTAAFQAPPSMGCSRQSLHYPLLEAIYAEW